MYKTFFNLARNPFDLTPDPAFLSPPNGTTRRWRRFIMAFGGIRDLLW